MSKLNIIRRCYNCGAILQNDNPEGEGYVAEKKLLSSSLDRVLFCDKCYKDSGYNLEPHEASVSEDFLTMLKDAAASDALIVYVIDLCYFEASFVSAVSSIIKTNPILVIANKRDLLPKEANDEYLKEYVAHRFRVASIPLKSTEVILTSLVCFGDTGPIAKRIDEMRRRHDVYIIGARGAGKSLFFSSFLRTFNNPSRLPITTSSYPGTKLSVMQIPLDNSSTLYDTPGTSLENFIYGKLEGPVASSLIAGNQFKMKKIALGKGDIVALGSLAFVKLEQSEDKREEVHLFLPSVVEIKTYGGSKDADAVISKLLEKKPLPPSSALLKTVKDFDVFEFAVEEEGMRDLGIAGLGWFSFVGKKQVFRLYVPRGVTIYTSRSKIQTYAIPKK